MNPALIILSFKKKRKITNKKLPDIANNEHETNLSKLVLDINGIIVISIYRSFNKESTDIEDYFVYFLSRREKDLTINNGFWYLTSGFNF